MSNIYGQNCLSYQKYYQYQERPGLSESYDVRPINQSHAGKEGKSGAIFLGANIASVLFKLLFASLGASSNDQAKRGMFDFSSLSLSL